MRHSNNWINVKWIPRVVWNSPCRGPSSLPFTNFIHLISGQTLRMRMPIACRVLFSVYFRFDFRTIWNRAVTLSHTHLHTLHASRLQKNPNPSLFIMWPNDMNESILQMGNRLFVVIRCRRRRRFWYRIAAHNIEAITHSKPLPFSLKNRKQTHLLSSI